MESTSGAPNPNASEAVSVPAILLMIAAILGVVFALFVIGASGESSMRWMMDNPNLPPQLRDQLLNSRQDPTVSRLFYGLQALLSGFVFFGALKMKNLQSYGLSMAAAIIACLPCCGPCCGCISIPLGVWSLVVLNKPEVKSAFPQS